MPIKMTRVALRISLLYGVIAALWILFSDSVLAMVVSDPALITRLGIYKGWGFVAITAALLYLTLRNQLGNLEREIAERRQAQTDLRASEQINREIIACAREGIIVTDHEYRYQIWNPFMEELTGLPASQVVGKIGYTLFPHLSQYGVKAILSRAFAGETVESPDMFFQVQETGKSGWVSSIYGPHYNPNGEICGAIGIVRDITARKHAEEKNEKIEAQLAQAQKMESVGRLAGGVAHDFNNMLGVVIGYAEMAMNQVGHDHPLYGDLREIHEAGRRSADLTRQLLAFARRQTTSPKVLDLNETITGMLKMLRRLIGEDIDLVWNPGRPLWKVRVDPSQLDQILANLAVNARDAIGGVGKIEIETANAILDAAYCAEHPGCAPGEYLLICVKDTGKGMAREVLEHIFEPFFTTKEVGKGTGLGLATVYGIVKQNSGFIDVESEPDQGTAFKIYLPPHTGEDDQPPASEVPSEAQRGTETILLVEDAEALIRLNIKILEKLGYRVLAALNPKQAFELARQHPGIHLLITDVVLPEMNGRELYEQLQAIQPQMKCLYMSGYTADVIAHRGVLDEGVAFLQKPYKLDDFASKIRDVLETSAAI